MIRTINILTKIKQSILTYNKSNIIQYYSNNKKYILSQFPYPSGQLHLGHARVYYIGDTLTRYYKLHNYNVIYPIGFDSFGLPAQNAAIVHDKNPKIWTQNNIIQMKQQLNCLNINFDWNRQFSTHTPQYYKWTQQIFINMLDKGLAYKAESQVNWDPIDKTVLANQQVDNLGRSWRSGAIVQKKMLSQWFFKITQYAQQLQNNLQKLQWIDKVKAMQAGWIGFRRGYLLNMKVLQICQQNIKATNLNLLDDMKKQYVTVFIKNKQDLNGNYYVRYNLNKQSPKQNETNLIKKQNNQNILGYLIDSFNKKIPIVVGHENNGIKFELITKNTQQKTKQNKQQQILRPLNLQQTHIMRIKDWSISRQRYWGTPIPIIYCQNCGIVPVPKQQLPILLPQWKGTGNPLLTQQFKKCKCPKCQSNAQRQTDTMDTFVDSSWYYLRFLDSLNKKQLCSKKEADYWMPVDIYIGGIQHAIMHLLYARFIMRTLSDLNVCAIKQPFKQLVVQGLVKGKTIKHKITGKYLKPDQIKNYSNQQLQETYQKMSKSKFNGLNPQTLVQKYGPDSLRIALFFASPPEHDIDFHQDLLVSADRFLKKVQQTHKNITTNQSKFNYKFVSVQKLKQKIHKLSQNHNNQSYKIKRILFKLSSSIQKRLMHVYIANTMQLYNEIRQIIKNNQQNKQLSQLVFSHIFIPILSVIAPLTIKNMYKMNEQQMNKIEWPKLQYFVNLKQYLIMKGNKLIKKGVVQYENVDGVINQQQIKKKLEIVGEVTIKDNKKSIVIITK